ncbi:helix-turn-helix transcriptional regulator [Parasedimentitalea huanghaiensis]|uniref:Helix-turn-helix domain-containing protein n=1 Tax=Parasedimentitalea huanghaiensis TaxID=2682100 RepID=A0A6L6WJH0_9RHOB|nr:helix-turn-helix transcriptional regulator [Zongyanglinia huanghaiensis]MVO17963.1 helix-turn-helix domain-containing protein [Zongyanglinia huanghaiensis]
MRRQARSIRLNHDGTKTPNSCGEFSIREFAKASLIELIAVYMQKHNPGKLSVSTDGIDALRQAQVPAGTKRDMLQMVARECGPEALLSIGQEIDQVTYDPVWRSALRSESPAVLFDKWHRFEVFAHSSNRVEIDPITETQARFRRSATGGAAPTPPENLLICGLIIGLLEGIGCRGLWCDMASQLGEPVRIRQQCDFCLPNNPAKLLTNNWTIGWQGHSISKAIDPPDNSSAQVDLPPVKDASLATLLKTMTDLMMLDVARQWKTDELASALGLSTRTLQRRLTQAGLSFSQLVRLVRISEACRLLKSGDISLTSIGFCAGFSDSSHFSRDFRASVGLTPSEFRAFQ